MLICSLKSVAAKAATAATVPTPLTVYFSSIKASASATYWAHSSKAKFHYVYNNGVGKFWMNVKVVEFIGGISFEATLEYCKKMVCSLYAHLGQITDDVNPANALIH